MMHAAEHRCDAMHLSIGGLTGARSRCANASMGRPHIEWIQAQALPWRRGVLAARAGAEAKILSADDTTGALSCILRYPPGYARGPEWLSADEEFWVLDGAIEVDGVQYGEHTYAHLPRTMPRSLRTKQQACQRVIPAPLRAFA